MIEENYKKAVNYEYGLDVKKDYREALKYYKLASKENSHARKKVIYSHFSVIEAILLLIVLIMGIIIDLKITFPWVGLFLIGISFTGITLFYMKKYWILTGYANILNTVILFLALVVILPYSVIKPYLNGITWIPVVLLFSAAIFIFLSALVLFFVDRNKTLLVVSIIGFLMLMGSIISFGIKTPDKLFNFKKVDEGIVITGYRSSGKKLKIPNKISGYDVVGIDDNAFSEWQFEEVILNNKLKYLGSYAFKNNRALKKIVIPDGVVLGYGVFSGNHSLEEIVLPSDLKKIPYALCSGCFSLNEVEIPSSVTIIQEEAFMNTGLTKIKLPENLVYLGGDAFSQTKIETLNLPNSLEYLGKLSNMPFLKSFNFPTSLNALPSGFLLGNKEIKELVIPFHIKYIGSYAFSKTNLETVVLHDEIFYEEGLFFQAEHLKQFTFPRSMDYIPKEMFSFSGIEEVCIPKFINSVGINAFAYAKSLKTLTLEEGVKLLESGAFMYTESLTSVEIPESVIMMGSDLFKGAAKLESIKIPSHTTKIPDRFLEDAYLLREINLVDNIKVIGKAGLKNTSLTSVILPKELETIEDYGFFGNKKLISVTFNDKLKTIKTHSFGSNTSLKILDFPLSLEKIDDYSFNGCNNLEYVSIKENVKMVGYWAFRSNPNMIIYITNNSYIDDWSREWNPFSAQILQN
ncbi:MAG: leucine-rich repeat protein [Acholeplasmataceae bacterium]|jgi:hypothetical protein|nr:leucine-rich repeat protein [Acholeplasmataceae bacterium]